MKANSKMTRCMGEAYTSRRMARNSEEYGSVGEGKEKERRLIWKAIYGGVSGILGRGSNTFKFGKTKRMELSRILH